MFFFFLEILHGGQVSANVLAVFCAQSIGLMNSVSNLTVLRYLRSRAATFLFLGALALLSTPLLFRDILPSCSRLSTRGPGSQRLCSPIIGQNVLDCWNMLRYVTPAYAIIRRPSNLMRKSGTSLAGTPPAVRPEYGRCVVSAHQIWLSSLVTSVSHCRLYHRGRYLQAPEP